MIEPKVFIKWEGLEYVVMLRRESVQISWQRIQDERKIMDGAWPLKEAKGDRTREKS